MAKNIWGFFIALVGSVAIGIGLFCVFFMVLCYFFPAVTSDGLHRTMPIAQAFLSTILATIAGLMILIFFFRKLKLKSKQVVP